MGVILTIMKRVKKTRWQALLWAAPVVDVSKFQPITENLSSGPTLLNQAISAGSLAGFLAGIFKVAIVVGAILAVLRIAYGGFIYMTTDAVGDKKKSKDIIQNAVVGLILLLAIVVILERINPNLLTLNFFLSPTTSDGTGAGIFARPISLPTSQ